MEVTLGQLIQLAPELASSLREDVRGGVLAARRKMGVAGRPYVLDTDALMASPRSEYRRLAEMAEANPLPQVRRSRKLGRATDVGGQDSAMIAPVLPLVKMMEAQHEMLQELVGVLTQEMRGRRDRLDRQQMEIQELSYKLGQAHQEIGRLERAIAERSVSLREQA